MSADHISIFSYWLFGNYFLHSDPSPSLQYLLTFVTMIYCFPFYCENKRKWESTFSHLHPVHLSFPSSPLSSKIFPRSVNGDSESPGAPHKSLQVILGATFYFVPWVKFVSNCWLPCVQNMFITRWLLAFLFKHFILFWPIMLQHDFSIFFLPNELDVHFFNLLIASQLTTNMIPKSNNVPSLYRTNVCPSH